MTSVPKLMVFDELKQSEETNSIATSMAKSQTRKCDTSLFA